MIGHTIGRYKILHKLGAGGMGEVYLAEDTDLHRQDALKFLPEAMTSTPEARARFKHEAQAAAALNHPNIVTIYEVTEHQGRPYIVMEYVEGYTLSEYNRERGPSVDQVLDLTIQIADGLQKAHENGIVHRDLKPANILVDGDGRPKIVDFGLAKLKGATKLTATGSTLGTAFYISPEQSQGDKLDHRTDLWSLGIILYELLANRLPFEGEHEAAIAYTIVHEQPEPLSRYKTGIPDDLQRVVSKCLAKDPGERYQSAADLAADLKTLRRTSGVSGVTTAPPKVRNVKNRATLTGSVVVLAALVFFLVNPFELKLSSEKPAEASVDRLAVMYFENLVDPADKGRLGQIVTNLLITDVSESDYIEVVSDQRLYDILKQLGLEDQQQIDREVATEVATRAKGRWMLLGKILQVEPELIVTSQLVDVATGTVIATQKIQGDKQETVFALVDRLTVQVKQELPLPPEAMQELDRPVVELTTSSPEAYRLYVEAVGLTHRNYTTEARKLLQDAVELDSTFAMAYVRLVFLTEGKTRQLMMARAQQYSERVGLRERLYVSFMQEYMARRYDSAVAILTRLVERFPDDKEAFRWLAGISRVHLGHHRKAIGYYHKVLEIDSLADETYNLLANAYSDRDVADYDSALWAINRCISLVPEEPNYLDTRGDVHRKAGDLHRAAQEYRQALELDPEFGFSLEKLGRIHVIWRQYESADSIFRRQVAHSDPLERAYGRMSLARLEIHRGRFDEALRRWELGIQMDSIELGDDWPGSRIHKHWRRSLLNYFVLEDIAAGDEDTKALTRIVRRIDSTAAGYSRWLGLARSREAIMYAQRGDEADARQTLSNLYARVDTLSEREVTVYELAIGAMHYQIGNYDSAITHLEAMTWGPEMPSQWVLLGMAYLEVGRFEEAIPLLGRNCLRPDAIFPPAGDEQWAIQLRYYLARAYEGAGRIPEAISSYEFFLDHWGECTPMINMVRDAKSRVANLKSSGA